MRRESSTNAFALVLAGGKGERLMPLVRELYGVEVPKQFCQLVGCKTLIEHALERAALTVGIENVHVLLSAAHMRFSERVTGSLPPRSVIVQPADRGTGVALLYALMKLAIAAPDASVVVFPADHYVSDEALFARQVRVALELVEGRPEFIVMMGIVPDRVESGYGWIEPGEHIGSDWGSARYVKRFWEKPPREKALELFERGALWNSFVFAGRVVTMLSQIMVASPSTYVIFQEIREKLYTARERAAVAEAYAAVRPLNFSADVLERHGMNLVTIPVHGVEWSDLGEPSRVRAILSRQRSHTVAS